MALRRKKRYENAVRCSIYKEKRAFHTVHGSYRHGGHTCCDICFKILKTEHEKELEKERLCEPTEADYQTWMRL